MPNANALHALLRRPPQRARTPLQWTIFLLLAIACCSCDDAPQQTEQTDPVPLPPSQSSINHLQRAQEHMVNGQYLEAVSACQAGLAIDSTSVDLLNIMATAHASEGRYALAIAALERIRALRPDFALTYLNLGGIYTKLGQYESAEHYLLQALTHAPNQPEVHRRLGEVYLGTERFAEAAAQFNEAIRLFPNASTLHYYLGRAYEGAGNDDDALVAFAESTQLDSGFAEGFYRLAQLARRAGRADLARLSMQKFQRLQRIGAGDPDVPKQMKKLRASILNAPESPLYHERLGAFFAQHGFLDEAENLFDLASELPGAEVEQHRRMGALMLRYKRPLSALRLFKAALRTQPQHIPTLLNAGVALELLKRGQEARAYYERVQHLAPDDPRGWYAYGLSEFNAGRPVRARQAWQKSLERAGPGHPLHEQIQQRLAQLNGQK